MLIAAFANLYLNVRKPREILPDLRTLGSPVAWASGRGCRVPAGHEGRLRPVPRGRTRGRRDSAPDEDPRSTSSPTRSRRRGARAVGPTRCGGAGGEPESPRPALSTSLPPSRVSGWPGRSSAEGLGLRYPPQPGCKVPPQPSRQTSKRGLETRLRARRGGTPGSQLSCGRGSSRGGSYISHPHVRSEGGSKSLPSTRLRFFPPSLRLSRRASPRPVLGAPRPPSRAAPRGAESSRAATRDASPV